MIDPADNDEPGGEPRIDVKPSAPAFPVGTSFPTTGMTLLGCFGHELRNHLAPIYNALFLLRGRTQDSESRAMLDLITQQVGQVIRSFEHMAEAENFSRDNVKLDRRAVELEQVIDAAITPLQSKIEEKGPLFHFAPRPWRGSLHADAARLAYAVRTALLFALYRTEDAGDIRVEIETIATDAIIRVRGSPPQTDADEITGLAARDSALRRAPSVLAIDLAVAARIVQLHGGRMAGVDMQQRGALNLEIRLPLS